MKEKVYSVLDFEASDTNEKNERRMKKQLRASLWTTNILFIVG
jgi:hypothetical protein